MSTLVESLKRLHNSGSVTLVKLDNMLLDGKITQEEYNYITQEV